MKKIILMMSLVLMTAQSFAAQENFNQVLSRIQNSNWQGDFSFNALGTVCSGPLKVHFFPSQVEDFSGGETTVSYRHDADFTGNYDRFCQMIGKSLSVVDIGSCESTFPLKFSAVENKEVPFRTIIPRQGGTRAFVSSPSCNKRTQQTVRDELELIKAELSPDQQTLDLTIRVVVLKIKVDLKYKMTRQ